MVCYIKSIMKKRILLNLTVCLFLLITQILVSQEKIKQEKLTLNLEHVSGNVYNLNGQGGNIGILKSDTGLLVVDSKYDRTTDEVMKKIAEVSSKPIKFLINTHYHGDHTGGNEVVGNNAIIVSHQNCKSSLLKGLKARNKESKSASSIKTFDKKKVIQFGTEKVKLLYLGPAHTSGDTVVIFEKSKVVHMGDLFFFEMPPYIDVKDGSNTENWIRIIETVCKKYPDFKIIPGHGKVTNTKNLQKFADYLKYLRKEVKAAIKAGKTREQAMNEISLTDFDHIKDNKRFLTKKNNIGWIYDEMIRKDK